MPPLIPFAQALRPSRASPADRDPQALHLRRGSALLPGQELLEALLGPDLLRASLHEVYAGEWVDVPAATGFAVGLALQAAGTHPILWVRHDFLEVEAGRLHAPGLSQLGLDPERVLLVRAHDVASVLRAGLEGARCPAIGAVLIEFRGETRLFDLTASRRLALAAETSGVSCLVLRSAAAPRPSAARTRWLVRALPSEPWEVPVPGDPPGDPSFSIALLRHRGGRDGGEWRVEWDRDRRCFRDRSFLAGEGRSRLVPLRGQPSEPSPSSRPLASLPADRPAAAARLRRAG